MGSLVQDQSTRISQRVRSAFVLLLAGLVTVLAAIGVNDAAKHPVGIIPEIDSESATSRGTLPSVTAFNNKRVKVSGQWDRTDNGGPISFRSLDGSWGIPQRWFIDAPTAIHVFKKCRPDLDSAGLLVGTLRVWPNLPGSPFPYDVGIVPDPDLGNGTTLRGSLHDASYSAMIVILLLTPLWLRHVLLLFQGIIPLSDSHRCENCGYDLRGSPRRCPECGTKAATSPAYRLDLNPHRAAERV